MSDLAIERGLIHVYTGEGKGKTTAALGVALRALGWGARVCVVQFIKGYADIGEARFARDFGERFVLKQFAETSTRGIGEADVLQRRQQAEAALAYAERAVSGGDYDLIVLDEINNALHYGLVGVPRVLAMLAGRPAGVETILTGRDAPSEIIDAADYVTEMTLIKHPYQRGVPARPFIDY